jgi:hypothetical protein
LKYIVKKHQLRDRGSKGTGYRREEWMREFGMCSGHSKVWKGLEGTLNEKITECYGISSLGGSGVII